jgi:hypothetical protein
MMIFTGIVKSCGLPSLGQRDVYMSGDTNEKDDAWMSHARQVPLIHSTDPNHLPETVEQILMAIEFLSERAGVRVRELWPIVQKRVVERKDAEYHAMFAQMAEEKERVRLNKIWITEIGEEVLKDAIVLPENGAPTPYEKFKCSQCKAYLLVGPAAKKFVQLRYQYHRFSLATKAELIQTLRKDILDGRTSTYIACVCRNRTSNFRMMSQ